MKTIQSIADLSEYSLKQKEFEYPELGGSLILRELAGTDAHLMSAMANDYTPDLAMKIVQASAVNEKGNLIFEGKDGYNAIRRMSFKLVQKIFMDCLSLGNVTDDAIDQAKKDSGETDLSD